MNYTPNSFFSQNQPSEIVPMNISQQNVKVPTFPLYKIIAIGNPIVDITAEIDLEGINKLGLAWGQTVFANEKNIGYFDELEKKPEVTYTPGGAIQNTLRVCAWCLNMEPKNKGLFKLTMLGCVGDDIYKDKIINALDATSVKPLLQSIPGLKTSRCAVGIYNKERCLVPEIRASNNLSKDFINENQSEIFDHDVLMIEGYFLQERFEICQYLCNQFSNSGKQIILTLCAIFMVTAHKEKIMEIANKANMIVGNVEEIEALAGKKGKSFEETFELAHKKLARKDRTLIGTAGSQGVFCSKYDYDNNKLDFVIQTFPKFVKNEEISDLNSAGDAFLGGFLSQYLKGRELIDCCKVGNDAAGVIIKNVGCTFPKTLKLDFAKEQ